MAKKRNLSWKLMAAATAALLLVIVLILALSDGPPPDPVEPDATTPRGFTFLDMHADTRLTDGLRSRLSDQLGSMAVEKQSVIDLELHHNGFLKTHFKRLDGLNRRLNYENGMKVRIEHDATKLIFRYSPLFDYVALYFANNSGKPLMFRIRAKKDGTDIVDTVREKYGPPRKISWEDRPGTSFYWQQDTDAFIISLFSNRYDEPQYEIMICHVANIEKMLAKETGSPEGIHQDRTRQDNRLF